MMRIMIVGMIGEQHGRERSRTCVLLGGRNDRSELICDIEEGECYSVAGCTDGVSAGGARARANFMVEWSKRRLAKRIGYVERVGGKTELPAEIF